MANVFSITADHSDVSQNSYTTASVSPVANILYLFATSTSLSGGSNTPTVSGASMTWSQIATEAVGNAGITLFRAMAASPGSGALTISFGGQSQSNCYWSLSAVYGTVNDSANNGSNLIVQNVVNSATGTNTSLSVTLASLTKPDNITFGCFNENAANAVTILGTFKELSQVGSFHIQETDWSPAGVLTNTWSFSSISAALVGIGVEIKTLQTGGSFLENLL